MVPFYFDAKADIKGGIDYPVLIIYFRWAMIV